MEQFNSAKSLATAVARLFQKLSVPKCPTTLAMPARFVKMFYAGGYEVALLVI